MPYRKANKKHSHHNPTIFPGSSQSPKTHRGFGEKHDRQRNAESSPEQRGLKKDRIFPHHAKELAASAIDPKLAELNCESDEGPRSADGFLSIARSDEPPSSPGGKNEGNTQTGCINDDETQRILQAFGKRPVASQEAKAKDSRSNSDRKSSEHGNRSRIDLLLRDGRMASNHQGGCKAEILREVSTAHSLEENNHRAVRGGVK